MKNLLIAVTMIITIVLFACSGPKTTGSTKTVAMADSSVRDVPGVSNKELTGKWDVITMRRTQDAEPEALSDVFITFADSSFGGKAPCNHIGGTYTLQGNNIGFNDIISTKMACERSDQENFLVNLLDTKVTNFSLSENSLLLKDDSARIVLECKKTE